MKAFFILLSLFISAADAADDWLKKNPPDPVPAARFGHALAYIGDDKILCYGGNGGYPGPYGYDTWVYDLSDNSWTALDMNSPISYRRDHAMAYIGGDNVLLFGGYYPAYQGDTWLFNLSAGSWRQFNPAVRPTDRYSHAMCYVGDDKILLHGGVGDRAYLDDLWMFDLSDSAWTKLVPAGPKPSPRHYHQLTKIAENKFLLYGGYDTATIKKDTWLYDLTANTWTELNPASNPLQRFQHAMVYIGDKKVMLYGGKKTSSSVMGETWVFDLDDTTWTKDENTISPPGLYQVSMSQTCLDGSRNVVLFGGASNSGEINETWTFGGGDYIITGTGDTPDPPSSFSLEQNYPNPFNPVTHITYSLPENTDVTLTIFDVIGNRIAVIVKESQAAGKHKISYSAAGLTGGVYFYRLTAGKYSLTRKMIVLK